MNEDIKKRIEELEEQKDKISFEIWELEKSLKDWYVGRIDSEYNTKYVRLGHCSYENALSKMSGYEDYTSVIEIDEYKNNLFMKWESIAAIISNIGDLIYREKGEVKLELYNKLYKDFIVEKQNIQDELDISHYADIEWR